MNVFGAFSFGGLIKTFLPGFIWVLALGVWLHVFGLDAAYFYTNHNDIAFPVVIALSVIFGLLSNTVMFMGVLDLLIRKPHENSSANVGLYLLKKRVDEEIINEAADGLGLRRTDHTAAFGVVADPEILIERRASANQFASFRESYWFFMEFQLNMLLSIAAAGAGVAGLIALGPATAVVKLLNVGLLLGGLGLFMWFLWSAAMRNYDRHRRKMISLCVSAYLNKPSS